MVSDQAGEGARTLQSTAPRRPAPLTARSTRLLSGSLLVAIALGGVALVSIPVANLRNHLSHLPLTSLHTLVVVALDGFMVAWLLAVVLGCLLVGAMSLTLAFTRQGW